MINQFKLPSDNPEYTAYCDNTLPETALKPLSQINYFIGPNNSGKSRLLRLLLKDLANYITPPIPEKNSRIQKVANRNLSLFFIPFELILDKLKPSIEVFDSWIKNFKSQKSFAEKIERLVGTNLDEFELIDFFNELNHLFSTINNAEFDKVKVFAESKERERQDYVHGLFAEMLGAVKSLIPQNNKYHFTYVPSFRTLRRFMTESEVKDDMSAYFTTGKSYNYEILEQDVFKSRVVFDYFLTKSDFSMGVVVHNQTKYKHTLDTEYIFTGESLFDELKRLRNSGEKDRKS